MSIGALAQPHDFIRISVSNSSLVSEKCIELYASGLSFAEIAQEVGRSKSTVISHVKKHLKSKRPESKFSAEVVRRNRRKRSSIPPYGFLFLEGKKVGDPKEQFVIRKIVELRKLGCGPCSIARELNALGIKSRGQCKWHHGTVSAIIRRTQMRS